MGSTCKQGSICNELLARCLSGEAWTEAELRAALAEEQGRTFLSVVVERLGDLFEPRLCDVYAELFTQAIAIEYPELTPRVRRAPSSRNGAPEKVPESVDRVYVLSRVTLGADIAVTSVLIDAVKRRWPSAEIRLVGPRKNFELFEADLRVKHHEAPYPRSSSLHDRLEASAALELRDGIVIDPDSRLTQLGLVRVCDDRDYFFFESRSYGGEDDEARLPELAARWAGEVLGVKDAAPYIAPMAASGPAADITVSLGVGENASKRIDGEFERQLLRILAQTGAAVLVDKGAGAEERARVDAALQAGMRTHEGAFAPFAAAIAGSKLFVGYDSAGGHVASACGVPAISIGKGFASRRMAARWRPQGTVIRGERPDVLDAVREAITCTFRR